MARHKLPIFTERTIAVTKADQIQHAHAFADKLTVVSCKSGCSNCCAHALYVTLPEGILVFKHLTQRGLWTPSLRKRVEEHSQKTWDVSTVVWHLSNLPCPFLEKNLCTVYDARPFPCRVSFSSGDPQYCHPHYVNANVPLIPKREALESFYEAQKRLLKRHRLDAVLFSLSKAVLIAEKVVSGEIDFEEFLRLFMETPT